MKAAKILSGPLFAAAVYLLLRNIQPEEAAARMGAVAVWMAFWWMLEAVPMAVTSLVPVFLFPISGILTADEVAPLYMNDVLMLFMGGFLIALAMERWSLHKRIALRIIQFIGTDLHRILFGVMLATYVLSMWVSNTATTLMLLPTVMAIVTRIEEITGRKSTKAGIALLLGLAYAASIGGMATLVGTPTNLIFMSQYKALFPDAQPIGFLQWSLFGIPFSFVLLVVCYFLLVKLHMKGEALSADHDRGVFERELRTLGKMTFEEKVIMGLFIAMTTLWFTRADLPLGSITLPGWSNLMPRPGFFSDGTVAIFIAVLLFLIPSKSKQGEMLMDWNAAKSLPFGIILLFGGGFALAKGFATSGLANWMGGQLSVIADLPIYLTIFIICVVVCVLSEVASNVASAQLILPVLAAVAAAANIPPLLFMIPATFASSFGFMLPVATAPNTIVFTGEKLTVKDMMRAGFLLDFIGIVWMTISMYLYGRWVFNL